jgi:hypothetical protein
MRVFTKVNGKLAVWQVPDDMTLEQALEAVHQEVGSEHTTAILALVKY